MRKLIGALLIFGLLMAVSAAAQEITVTLDGVTYTVEDNAILSVSGSCADGTLIVPGQIGGQPIRSIGSFAFEGTTFTSVVLPDGLEVIGWSAFYKCTQLQSITIPHTVTRVEGQCFLGCTALEEITFPPKVDVLESFVLSQCTSLHTVTFLAPETDLSDLLIFHGCPSLQRIIGQVSAVGEDTFLASENLTEISLADSVTVFPAALSGMKKLTVTIGQASPLRDQLINSGRPCRIRETGELFNVVDGNAATVAQKVQAVVATVIRDGMSDYQKALALHNWLIYNAEYDYTYSNYGPDGVLLKGTGVCESYAEAYALLLNAVGIPNCKEHGSNHVWNMIQLDGEWYHVDCTWDDPSSYTGPAMQDFFCVTNYALTGVPSHECYNKPHIAASYKYSYAYQTGALDERLAECKDIILQHLSAGETQFSFTPVTFDDSWTDLYGILARTAILVMQDTVYEVNGKAARLTINYDSPSMTVTVAVSGMSAPDLILPAGLTTIGAEAFAGTTFRVVELPEGLISISARAFADCKNLLQIEIPASVTNIAEDAFSGVSGLCIFGYTNSTAEKYAADHHYDFFPLN